MLKLCICEDNRADLAAVEALTADFVRRYPHFSVRTWSFHSSFSLLEYLETKGGFDLYLLDVLLPHFTGIELACHIRKQQESAEILFLTVSREYAVEAFRVKASDYLMKPLDPAVFEQTLLTSIQRLSAPESAFLLVKTQEGLRKVTFRELVLIESFDHSCSCTLANGSCLNTWSTLFSLMEQLEEDARFFSPHRSYIVNMDFISGFTSTAIIMADGRQIPISRKQQNTLKKAYREYMFR